MVRRTTVRLPAELLKAAKKRAAATGRTLTALIEAALRHELEAPRKRAARPFRMRTFGRGGLLPGVPPLDDNPALAGYMDEIERR